MVVTASLVSPVVAAAPVKKATSEPGAVTGGELDGTTSGYGSAVWWGIGCAVFALAVLLVHRRFRHWWVYLIGAAGFLVLLFYFFGQLNPLLPAGY